MSGVYDLEVDADLAEEARWFCADTWQAIDEVFGRDGDRVVDLDDDGYAHGEVP